MRRPRARGGRGGTGTAVARTALAALAAAAAAVCWSPPLASAAPQACPDSLLDRYEPGDEVTLVGYTEGCIHDIAQPSPTGQPAVLAYLHPDPCKDSEVACMGPPQLTDPASGTFLERVTLEPTVHEPRGQRMSVTFTLPADLDPGLYYLMFCQEPCDPRLFDGWPNALYVGMDPPGGSRHVRYWPLDDPAVAELPDDALILGPDGEEITAAQARVATTTTTSTTEADAADRVELAAEPTGENDEGLGPALWIPVAALVVGGGWLVLRRGSRRGSGRKQVRRPG